MSQNSKNQGFSYYLCLMKEGSGFVQIMVDTGSGSSKNIRIRTGIDVFLCQGARGSGGVRLLYSPEEVEHAAKEMIGDFLITKQTGAEGRSGRRGGGALVERLLL
jgi:hypothetical protein